MKLLLVLLASYLCAEENVPWPAITVFETDGCHVIEGRIDRKLAALSWSPSDPRIMVKLNWSIEYAPPQYVDQIEMAIAELQSILPCVRLEQTYFSETGNADDTIVFRWQRHPKMGANTIALAYYPWVPETDRGDVWYNPDADWEKYSIYSISLHELGHVMGMGHMLVDSVMYPYYRPWEHYFPADLDFLEWLYTVKRNQDTGRAANPCISRARPASVGR